MKNFEGRVAVITGGASGIGLALAHRFGGVGMKVVVGDVEKASLDTAIFDLRDKGIDAHGIPCDVTSANDVQALADGAIELFGGVNIFCNNAGVGAGGLSWEASLSMWEWVIGVNLWGVIHGIRSFVPLLLGQDEAHIVNTASVAGLVSAPMMGPYNASKHAVVALSETLHHEFALTGASVGVSVLCPGWVRTKIATSERNRPDHLAAEPSSVDSVSGEIASSVIAGMIESGMQPNAVADKVLQAVTDRQFWVLTHDEDDMWMRAVNSKVESLLSRDNPVMNLLG